MNWKERAGIVRGRIEDAGLHEYAEISKVTCEFKQVPTADQPLMRKFSSAWCRGTSNSLLLIVTFCPRINFKCSSHLTYHTWENTFICNNKIIRWWVLCSGIWHHIPHHHHYHIMCSSSSNSRSRMTFQVAYIYFVSRGLRLSYQTLHHVD